MSKCPKRAYREPIMNFLIAYDIADPKRLRAVAKKMVAKARRAQKSVFIFTGTRRELDWLLGEISTEVELSEDRIQAWPIRTSNHVHRRDLGQTCPDFGLAAIISDENLTVIEAVDGPVTDDAPLNDI